MARGKPKDSGETPEPPKVGKRDRELSGKHEIDEKLQKLFDDVEKGFADQRTRADDSMDFWDSYNCILGERQFYNGNSKIFLPIIQVAIDARVTRFTNQIFPQSGRNVEVVTTDGEIPHASVALAEHYVETTHLRTEVVPALLRAGDVEGQMSVYCGWQKTTRWAVRREQRPVTVEVIKGQSVDVPELGKIEDTIEEKVIEAGPYVEVIPDSDILVLPATSQNIDQAIERGGSVTVLRRWSKSQLEKMIDDGDIRKDVGEAVIESMSKVDQPRPQDVGKRLAEAAGIWVAGESKYILGYETWTKLKVDGKKRICVARYAGDQQILGCKLNPYWCDKVPVISGPVKKMPGVFKGPSKIKPGVLDMQVWANDTVNEAADQGHFAMFPITMTDPASNPRIGSMILALGAVWEANPKTTRVVQFPDTTQQAINKIQAAKTAIMEALGVNPSMVPQQTGGPKKRSQAEVALEQQVDILTTADAVINVEQQILTPLVQRFLEYDHQFREKGVLVRSFGELGLRALMEEIPPQQMNRRWLLRWFGVEAARNAQQIQQQIAGVNVVMKLPPQTYQGYTLDLTPAITNLMENLFGPRLAPKIFKSVREQLAVDPELENEMLAQGFDLAVHPLDDDPKHLKAHMQLMAGGDPTGNVRVHMQKHQTSMQMKVQANMMRQGQQGAQPGGAGAPQPGGQVQGPRLLKGPPGMINQDRMARAGVAAMPRKM